MQMYEKETTLPMIQISFLRLGMLINKPIQLS